MSRLAVVLFNLGGPDRQEAVQPFLFNLFNDAAIIDVPMPLRWCLAQIISRRRAPIARTIYAKLGGGSPLLANTRAQAQALAARLAHHGEVRVFVSMRYWHPMSAEVAREVKAYGPDRIVLLPLYPQFSTTTTASSLRDWKRSADRAGLAVPTRIIGCYPTDPGLIAGMSARIEAALREASGTGTPRLLFSAHGLPRKIVAAGDPYQHQVEQTAAAVVRELARLKLAGPELDWPKLDWAVCYQSRVGPLEWIGPSTDAEIRRAGRDRVPVVIAPIAFVSDHAETLVEIEIEYRHQALAAGVPLFLRVPALGTEQNFVDGLARQVDAALSRPDAAGAAMAEAWSIHAGMGEQACPVNLARCGCR